VYWCCFECAWNKWGENDDQKHEFYEEIEQVFDHLSKYHMKILLIDLNAKVGGENILKPTIGNDSLRQIVLIMVLK
jgi:hypothetical protein